MSMRPRLARATTALAVLAVLAQGGVVQSYPVADAQNRGREHPRLTSGAPVEGEGEHDPHDVAQFARSHGLSEPAARRYFALADQVNQFGEGLRGSEVRDQLGGMFLDTDRWGYVVIQVVGDGSTVQEYTERNFRHLDFIEYRAVTNTQATLLHAEVELNREVGPGAITAIWMDEINNIIRVTVANGADDWQRRADDRFGPGVVTVSQAVPGSVQDYHIPANNINCEDATRDHCNPLRAGIRLHRPNLATTYCTSGFPSRDSGRHYLITAAHCQIEHFDLIRHSNADIGGYVAPVAHGGNADAVRLRLDVAQWGIVAAYWATTDLRAFPIVSAFGGTFLTPGTPVCSSGVRTGHLCGVVRASNVGGTVGGATFNGLIGHSMCTNRGDSGAPIVNSGTAIAIHKGQYQIQDATGCYTWSSWVANVQARLGTTVITN